MSEEKPNPIKNIAKQILAKDTRKAMRKYPSKVRGQIKRLTLQPALEIATPLTIISMLHDEIPLSPEHIIQACQQGIYINDGETPDTITWGNPKIRCHIPINDFKLSKKMRQYIRQRRFEVRVDTDFSNVIRACTEERDVSWLTPDVIDNYLELHEMGVAHSVEAYQDGELVGGLLAMSLGSYVTTESLFYRVSRASKIAFAYLGIALRESDFALHDCQESNDLNMGFGSVEIDRDDFMNRLTHALIRPNNFPDTEQINHYMDELLPAKEK